MLAVFSDFNGSHLECCFRRKVVQVDCYRGKKDNTHEEQCTQFFFFSCPVLIYSIFGFMHYESELLSLKNDCLVIGENFHK